MTTSITNPDQPFDAAEIASLGGQLGVFELCDHHGNVVFIGFAGGRSPFGLRGELAAMLGRSDVATFRVELTSAYLTRYQELLMLHVARTGNLPRDVIVPPGVRLGRLSPAGD